MEDFLQQEFIHFMRETEKSHQNIIKSAEHQNSCIETLISHQERLIEILGKMQCLQTETLKTTEKMEHRYDSSLKLVLIGLLCLLLAVGGVPLKDVIAGFVKGLF